MTESGCCLEGVLVANNESSEVCPGTLGKIPKEYGMTETTQNIFLAKITKEMFLIKNIILLFVYPKLLNLY